MRIKKISSKVKLGKDQKEIIFYPGTFRDTLRSCHEDEWILSVPCGEGAWVYQIVGITVRERVLIKKSSSVSKLIIPNS